MGTFTRTTHLPNWIGEFQIRSSRAITTMKIAPWALKTPGKQSTRAMV
jgi:hypothetical protein